MLAVNNGAGSLGAWRREVGLVKLHSVNVGTGRKQGREQEEVDDPGGG